MASWVFKTIQYLKFLLRSTNKHGVHSPFVFDLITNCFNKKSVKRASDKITSISNYTIAYLKEYRAIVIDTYNTDFLETSKLLEEIADNSYLIILDPYSSKIKMTYWNELAKRKDVTASIDTFYVGFLFKRKEQPKQHFAIRV